MAILVSGGINSSQIKGKVGNNVFKCVNRKTVISAYQPVVRNPRTKAQRVVRTKFVRVTKSSRLLYDRAFRKYGVKLSGHSAYTSILRMVFNNPVVKSAGYADNFLPEYPTNNQKLIGCNTDLSNEVFAFLCFRWYRVGQNEQYAFCLSIPKGLFNYTPSGTPSDLYIGTNIPMNSLVLEILLQGTHRGTHKVKLSNFAINSRYGVDSDNTAISNVADEIGGMYKYIVGLEDSLNLATDPANPGNYLIGLSAALSNADFGINESPAFECYWPNTEKSNKIGATIIMFSEPKEDSAIDLEGNSLTPIYTRELMLAINDWSALCTIRS